MTDIIERNKANKPWQRHRAWKRKDGTLSFINLVELISNSFKTLQERAFFSCVYLTAGRISEILPKKHLFKHTYEKVKVGDKEMTARNKAKSPIIASTEQIPHNYTGLRKENITFEEIDNIKIMRFFIENRKNPKNVTKNIPIPIVREYAMVAMIKEYIKDLEPESVLFPFSVSKGEGIINKAAGLNAHFLRHIRATHLTMDYEFTEFQLMMFMGWQDGTPASKYIRIDWTKLVKNY